MESSYHRATETIERKLIQRFAAGIAYISVTKDGDDSIGTCFHIGEDIFITARHVVEGKRIAKIARTDVGVWLTMAGTTTGDVGAEAKSIEGPFFHSDKDLDIAALRVRGLFATQIPFLPVLEDPFANKLLLRPIVVAGYPPIPLSISPVLVCASGQVNASFESYVDKCRYNVVSCMARGGFSGGPVLTEPHHCLGMVVRALVNNHESEQLGFMAVMPPLPILEMLSENNIMPQYLVSEVWEPYMKQLEQRKSKRGR